MFKIGFCDVWGNEHTRENFSRLKALGYDGIELWQQVVLEREISEWEDILGESGLACAQLCPYFDFVDGQKLWDESIALAEQFVEFSLRLGRPLIRVFTGRPWGEGIVGPDDASEEQWNAAIKGLQRVCDLAAPHGVRYALECHTGSLMEDTPSTLRLLKAVARPNLGVNLQLPLKNGREPIDLSIESLGARTWHMHAHNYSSLVDPEYRTLDDGVLNYADILSRLAAMGFDGYVSIEHATHGGTRDPWEIARIESRFLLSLREKLASRFPQSS